MKRLLCWLRIHGPVEFRSADDDKRFQDPFCMWCGKKTR